MSVIIEELTVTPNPVDAGKTFVITIATREEYPDVKKYDYKYPYRYGEKE